MNKRLLIISHNIIDESNNVGKTIISMLRKWPKDDIYSIYFRNEIRTTMLCKASYMITDRDILKSFFSKIKICGQPVNLDENIEKKDGDKAAYRFGNRRYPLVSLLRDYLWHFKSWNTEGFKEWVNEVNPGLIFFIPNDYTLAFEIALSIKKMTSVPMVVFFTDDAFYYGQKISGVDKVRRHRLRTIGRDIIDLSSCIFTASELMRKEYKRVFGVESTVIGNCVEVSSNEAFGNWDLKENIVFSYIGNLHSNRWKSLIDLGQCIAEINLEKKMNISLNIYTASDLSHKVLHQIENVPTIHMMGSIPPDLVAETQEKSDALIHIEAFDEKSRKSTRLSMSTKIFEYMARGVPIFAYGPANIASIEFLDSNKYAVTCSDKKELNRKLNDFIDNPVEREESVRRARKYAKEYFGEDYISSQIYNTLSELLTVESD